MFFTQIEDVLNTVPFDDLWPPIYYSNNRDSHFARWDWFNWLTNGWVNNIPYRDLQTLDHRQVNNARNQHIRRRARRSRRIQARRRHSITTIVYNRYTLRSRVVPVTREVPRSYFVSEQVTLGITVIPRTRHFNHGLQFP